MIYWRGIAPWLLRAWPALAVLPIAAMHIAALQVFVEHSTAVNQIASVLLQIGGLALVLYSINSNLGMFRGESLWAIATAWLKAFPLKPKSITLSAAAHGVSTLTAALSGVASRVPLNIEERVTQLERNLREMNDRLQNDLRDISNRVAATRAELRQQIADTSGRVDTLSKRLEDASIGGFKIQVFGFLLAAYGIVLTALA